MKKIINPVLTAFILIASSIFLNSCVKDNCKSTYTYTYYIPVYETVTQLKANIKSSSPEGVENPGKIVILGNYIFLNEIEKGIHIIDDRNPASPQNVAFVNIPGNMDLALKGNTLYADSYSDLVTLDISDPLNVILKNYSENALSFPYYSSGIDYNAANKISGWIKKDTTINQNCAGGGGPIYYTGVYTFSSVQNSSVPAANSSGQVGKSGSMARFAIVNNIMYTVSNANLNVFNITIPNDPVYTNSVSVGNWSVETIFPFKDKLLIGSQNGMFVFDINDPDNPTLSGQFGHVQSCDPVIADDNYAYVTLRSGNACQGFTNELDILQLNSLTNPELVKTYSFTNPYGLSKDGNLLFICDGSDGLKIYDASDVSNLKLIKHFSGIQTYDVIAYNNIALVVAKDGLYQYDYSNVNNIHLVSKIGIIGK